METQNEILKKENGNIEKFIKRLYKTDPQIKKYIDYKMDYIKRAYKDMIIDLYNDILESYKSIEKLKEIYTKNEIEKMRAYCYQTPTTLNDLKGLVLTATLKDNVNISDPQPMATNGATGGLM